MKYYTFRREGNNFDDILSDISVKKNASTIIRFREGLIIGFKQKVDDKVLGYIVLKYGEFIKPLVVRDYSPKPNIDYVPKKSK